MEGGAPGGSEDEKEDEEVLTVGKNGMEAVMPCGGQ